MPRSMVTTTGPTLESPRWMGDYGTRDHIVPGGAKVLASGFTASDAVVVDVGAAGAAQFATTVPVGALSGPIPAGAVVTFNAGKMLRLAVAAAAAATSLTTDPIPLALVDADVSSYTGFGDKWIPSGTIVGRTIAERDANTGYGPAADADDEVLLVAYDVTDALRNDDVELYRPGGVVYENFLPAFAAASATIKGKIRAAYQCSVLLEG